jgi:hypothetical protein
VPHHFDNTDPGSIAEVSLSELDFYELGEVLAVHLEAWRMLDAATELGMNPREVACDLLIGLEASVVEDGFIDEECDLLRADLAMAAALVYTEQIASA